MSLESGKALKELSSAVRTMRQPTSADRYVSNSKTAAKNLESLLRSGLLEDADLLAVIPAATVASLLFDVVNCTEKITDAVHELASVANFECVKPSSTVSPEQSSLEESELVKPVSEIECPDHVVIGVGGLTSGSPENDTRRPEPLTNKHAEM
jgi:hypothetical protein